MAEETQQIVPSQKSVINRDQKLNQAKGNLLLMPHAEVHGPLTVTKQSGMTSANVIHRRSKQKQKAIHDPYACQGMMGKCVQHEPFSYASPVQLLGCGPYLR